MVTVPDTLPDLILRWEKAALVLPEVIE